MIPAVSTILHIFFFLLRGRKICEGHQKHFMQRRYRRPKPKKDPFKKFRVNHQIKATEVFIIDEKNEKLGVFKLSEALAKATQAEMDLVEVSPLAKPPVVKIMDYGQYKYETEKKIRKAKAHQKTTELKSIRLSFRIKGKDLETKRNQALKFLEAGNKVKIDIILKGREKAHRPRALENMKGFVNSLSLGGEIKIIQPITAQGGQITTTITKS